MLRKSYLSIAKLIEVFHQFPYEGSILKLLLYYCMCLKKKISQYYGVYVLSIDEAILNSLARERGFAVRDVPRDGNCLFSAVGMQLEDVGIQLGERNLRAELVEHLQSRPYTHGSSHLREYIVVSDDPFNADTEAPTEQDEFISSIEDPDL